MRFPGRTLFALGALAFVSAMVFSPRTVFEGATLGLKTWWNIVFPSLLPFFIISELLLGLGVVRLLGALLEPVMRPLFRLPGAASFAVAVGYSSGYPIGGAVTARLRSEGLVTRVEAEHLVAFTNNASPLFVLVAVAVGMFNQPAVGPFILGIHYLANMLIGLLLRFYAPAGRSRPAAARRGVWYRAWRGFLDTEGRPPGRILGEAVQSSVQKLTVIGGYIIFFAVAIRLLAHYGVLGLLARVLGTVLTPLGLDAALFEPVVAGGLEMTLGTRLAAEAPVPLLHKLVAVQLILAWSGLSIQAQVAAFTAGTDIRLRLYFASRVAHAALAGLITCLLFPLWAPAAPAAVPAVAVHLPPWGELLWISTAQALTLPLALTSLGLAAVCLRRLLHGL